MRDIDLPSPNIGSIGHHLRRVAAKAISYIQVNAPAHGGTHPNATFLRAFFSACADALAPFDASSATENTVPVLTFTPNAASFSIATGAADGPKLDKGGSPGAVTYTSSDPTKATVNAATGKVTPLVAGSTTITATIAAAPGFDGATKTYVATVTA